MIKYARDALLVMVLVGFVAVLPALYMSGYMKAHNNQSDGYSLINHADDYTHMNFISKMGYKTYIKEKYDL